MSASVLVLSLHQHYQCRDRGACCTAGWPIPIERSELRAAEREIAAGRLASPVGAPVLFLSADHPSGDAAALVATHRGHCVFHRQEGSRGCEIHRAMGHAALPLACRQFPRVSVHDPRGTSVTLSHYCPTAAALLETPGMVELRHDTPRFGAAAEYVGLDARAALPPLLRPGMLMDWSSWWMWERLSVDCIGVARSAEHALTSLCGAVERVRSWRPDDGPLSSLVAGAFAHMALPEEHTAHHGLDARTRAARDRWLVEAIVLSVPDDVRRHHAGHDLRDAAAPATTSATAHRGFLAAHAFANWTAYLGQGLRTWLASVEAADVLLRRGLTVGEADLWLRHLVDPRDLAARLARAEAER